MPRPTPSQDVRPLAASVSGTVFEFGDFRLDCGRFELLHKGRPLRLERKPMELLTLLTSRKGQLVTRAEIAQRLWSSEVFVDTEHGINTAIRKLRYILRDDSDDPQFILTVTGMGYRFIAPVTTLAAVSVMAPAPAEALIAPPAPPARGRNWGWAISACAILALAGTAVYRSRHRPPEVRYTQLTDFTDSAVAPAISPDGHMVAFIRGASPFLSTDQIYVKMLPNGEARRVTDDSREKYGLAFSPDGSEIAYTVLDGAGFSSWEVSALGGEPHLLMQNAAGLVWLDAQRLLFSEIRGLGIHMGVVTATPERTGVREIYFPPHERGMAHYSSPSPDRRWDLVVEMDGTGAWAPCLLVALAGDSAPRTAGPSTGCNAAGWSADGSWMYFTAYTGAQSHLWRQRFPDGAPEQITFGPTEEEGVAAEPTGRAVITSVGVHESSIWIHDEKGERPLSSEGEVVGWLSAPVFSPDDATLYYLLRRADSSDLELWRTALDSGRSEAVFPGVAMEAFDLSPDGARVVYTTAGSDGATQLWVAPLNRNSPAARVANVSGAQLPHFGAHGQIIFQHAEGNRNFLEQIDADGSHRSRVVPYPIVQFVGISPQRRWVIAGLAGTPEQKLPSTAIIPTNGGAWRRLCASYCEPRWSTDGKFLFVPVEDASRTSPGRSLAIPLGPDESLPELPASGIEPLADASAVAGARSVPRADLVPGKGLDQYAWVNTTVHRNLYRISLP